MIITKTPFRISFFGGGTDYPAWYQEHDGAVLATSINKYCYISLRYLPPFFEHKHRIVYSLIENIRNIEDIQHPAVRAVFQWANVIKGLEVHHDGDLPARSGLGSSSSFTVGLIKAIFALEGKLITNEELSKAAIHVEQNIIKENVGSQDQISAAYGGLNYIKFLKNNSFSVNPVVLTSERTNELESHLMLFFTGFSRIASEIAASKIANFSNRESELKTMYDMVNKAIEILQKDYSIEEFGRLLHESWMLKRSLSSQVSNSEIDNLYDSAMKAGAIGGKILGAGGGGFLLIFSKPENHNSIKKALQGLIHVPFRFEHSGSQVVMYQPNGL